MWVQRGSLTSAAAIADLVESAKTAGFNTLFVQVRGRGDAYYASRLEPRGQPLASRDDAFDPLQLVLRSGHAAGLAIHAWVNVNLVSDAEPPRSSMHVTHAHPEWLMVPRDLAEEASRIDRRSDAYLAMLKRYAKAHSDQIEGLYLSPIQPAAVAHTVSVVADIAARYEVDGIHLDYARYPNDDFDYSPGALAQFRSDLWPDLTRGERREYEERARHRPIFYTQMFPQRWHEYRQAKVTELVSRLRTAVKTARPNVVFSAAVWPDPDSAANRRMQNWRYWIESGLLDVVCPMAYTEDLATFRSQVAVARQAAGMRPVWTGIGAFHLSPEAVIEHINAARRLGSDGIVLFSYDNLIPHGSESSTYLSKVAEGAFSQQ